MALLKLLHCAKDPKRYFLCMCAFCVSIPVSSCCVCVCVRCEPDVVQYGVRLVPACRHHLELPRTERSTQTNGGRERERYAGIKEETLKNEFGLVEGVCVCLRVVVVVRKGGGGVSTSDPFPRFFPLCCQSE